MGKYNQSEKNQKTSSTLVSIRRLMISYLYTNTTTCCYGHTGLNSVSFEVNIKSTNDFIRSISSIITLNIYEERAIQIKVTQNFNI